MNELKTNECPIWVDVADVRPIGGLNYHVTSARAGGAYVIGLLAFNQMPTTPEFRARLTTWLLDQRRAGDDAPIIDQRVFDIVAARSPLMLSQRIERFFLYLSSLRFRPGQTIFTSPEQGRPSQMPEIMAWTESDHRDDATGLLDVLAASNLIKSVAPGMLRLTAEGFARLEAVELSAPVTSQAFVAMWFASEMDPIYANGFEPAIREAGYHSMRIDRKEHANKIDDEIIMEIRRSRFVVADFTCAISIDADGSKKADARGGVYYEAGFAQGLNIPVIWTVREDLISMVHFDTRQFAHITWTTADDLRHSLRSRIGAVIGPRI